MYNHIIFDFEALGQTSSSKVLDLSAIVFNIEEVENFNDIVNDSERCFRTKFDVVNHQKNRLTDGPTLQWWSEQGESAKKVLRPTKQDVSLRDGLEAFREFIQRHTLIGNKNTSLGFVRGPSYDFPMLTSIVQDAYAEGEVDLTRWPVAFWNQRDVRTFVSTALGIYTQRRMPVPVGTFEGFVAHNSLHDCARDVISIQYAHAFNQGIYTVPEEFEIA